jgi:hypothetical protein
MDFVSSIFNVFSRKSIILSTQFLFTPVTPPWFSVTPVSESIKEAACKKYKLTPKLSSSEKQKEKIKVLRENNSSKTKILGNKENDVTNFLSSSKSFSQYYKERMDTFFVPKSIAETNVQKRE